MAAEDAQDVYIYIEPEARGHFTERDLIGDRGAVSIRADLSVFNIAGRKVFFRVLAQNYSLEAGLAKNAAYVTRNHIKVKFPIKVRYFKRQIRVNGSLQDIFEPIEAELIIRWTPNQLSISCQETVYFLHFSSAEDLSHKILRRLPVPSAHPLANKDIRALTISRDTPPTRAPNKLIQWVRDKDVEATSHNSAADFYKEVVTLFQSVLDTVKRASAYSAFWDENGKKTPKKESKITPIIHQQLLTPARIKGFEVTHQDTGAGILDFRVGASLSDGKKTFVCIECKHAHSRRLEHGLTVQLPEYMRQRECEFGLYCVFWFKGPDFPNPKKFSNPDNMTEYLNYVKYEEGLHNIRVLPLDLSYPEPPSVVVSGDQDQRPSWATPENVFLVDYFGMMPQEHVYYQRLNKGIELGLG
jgi:hypothetical protein